MIDLNALIHLSSGTSILHKGAVLSCLAEEPSLVLGLTWAADWDSFDDRALSVIVNNHRVLISQKVYTPRFRCVDIVRLPYILANGCDVTPTDAVFWVDMFPSKALEYGGETKVMMVFDAKKLQNSGREVRTDIAPEELDRLRAVYPTILKAADGQHLWLSRLPENDRRVESPYEVEHGRWIQGDPWEALRLLIVLAHSESHFPILA